MTRKIYNFKKLILKIYLKGNKKIIKLENKNKKLLEIINDRDFNLILNNKIKKLDKQINKINNDIEKITLINNIKNYYENVNTIQNMIMI